jgi:hypothetical protein
MTLTTSSYRLQREFLLFQSSTQSEFRLLCRTGASTAAPATTSGAKSTQYAPAKGGIPTTAAPVKSGPGAFANPSGAGNTRSQRGPAGAGDVKITTMDDAPSVDSDPRDLLHDKGKLWLSSGKTPAHILQSLFGDFMRTVLPSSEHGRIDQLYQAFKTIDQECKLGARSHESMLIISHGVA